ncbi:uncharacterized protein SCODWIG_01637 [Saccharomycodes ludwigii]|uniref:Karyogamy protein KAR9 n=1 Tax=Saccharomycodes ludwigii TaxID=36035 RepID=A0A376B5B3_9ASCO|nr:uncharacterized protein SCODWIG_01637 [Saccharomycodes ludwigii]
MSIIPSVRITKNPSKKLSLLLQSILDALATTILEIDEQIDTDRIEGQFSCLDFENCATLLDQQLDEVAKIFKQILFEKDQALDRSYLSEYIDWLHDGKKQFYSILQALQKVEHLLVKILDVIETKHAESIDSSFSTIFDLIEKCSEKYAILKTLCSYLQQHFGIISEFKEIYCEFMDSLDIEIGKMFSKLLIFRDLNLDFDNSIPNINILIKILNESTINGIESPKNKSTPSICRNHEPLAHQLPAFTLDDNSKWELFSEEIISNFKPLNTSITEILAEKIGDFKNSHENFENLVQLIELIAKKYNNLTKKFEILENEIMDFKTEIIMDRWKQVYYHNCNTIENLLNNVLPTNHVKYKNCMELNGNNEMLKFYRKKIYGNILIIEKILKFISQLTEQDFWLQEGSKSNFNNKSNCYRGGSTSNIDLLYKKNELIFQWLKIKKELGLVDEIVDSIKKQEFSEPPVSMAIGTSSTHEVKRDQKSNNNSVSHSIRSNNTDGKSKNKSHGTTRNISIRKSYMSSTQNRESSRISSNLSDENYCGGNACNKIKRLSTFENIEEWENLSKEVRKQSIGALIHQKMNIVPIIVSNTPESQSSGRAYFDTLEPEVCRAERKNDKYEFDGCINDILEYERNNTRGEVATPEFLNPTVLAEGSYLHEAGLDFVQSSSPTEANVDVGGVLGTLKSEDGKTGKNHADDIGSNDNSHIATISSERMSPKYENDGDIREKDNDSDDCSDLNKTFISLNIPKNRTNENRDFEKLFKERIISNANVKSKIPNLKNRGSADVLINTGIENNEINGTSNALSNSVSRILSLCSTKKSSKSLSLSFDGYCCSIPEKNKILRKPTPLKELLVNNSRTPTTVYN